MKSSEWKTYRTRFLVKAKQLTSTLSFTDHLGRQHCGRRGDYLVESSDGVLSIAPRQIFEDIYVAMSGNHNPPSESSTRLSLIDAEERNPLNLNSLRIEPLKVERIKDESFRSRLNDRPHPDQPGVSRVRRKSPQPVRDTASRMSLM